MVALRQHRSTGIKIALVASALLLTLIGFIFIYSSSSIYAMERYGTPFYYVKRQLYGLMLGLALMGGTMLVRPRFLQKTAPILFFGTLGLTALTLIPGFGVTVHASCRWLNLFSIVCQPSELLKPTTILFLSSFLARHYFAPRPLVSVYLPILGVVGILSGILLMQPDFGQTVTIALTVLALLGAASIPARYLCLTLGAALPAALALIIAKPYRLERLLTFLNPWQDPQGKGFQIIQSLIAIGSGGCWGVGIAHSKQKFFYLPMQHTDFIFSIIAEETGFIGCLTIIGLFVICGLCGIKLALKNRDLFSRLTIFGCSFIIMLQAFVNMSVVTALLPTKGLSLPFISYGNTALMSSLWLVGIMISCARSHE